MTTPKFIRSTFAAVAALLAIASQAVAPPAVADGYSGPYIGAALVYGWAKTDGRVDRLSSGFVLPFSDKAEGVALAGFAGYDWTIAPKVVFGVVGDIGVTKVGSRSGVSTIGDLRGRLGYLVTPETLVYGTGGVAFLRQNLSGRLGGFEYSVSETNAGSVWGGGIESRRMLAEHPVRFGLELLRYDFNPLSFEVPDRRVTLDSSAWTLGARLSFELDRGRTYTQPMK